MYISMPYRILSSPSRSNPIAEDPPCLLMVCCILSTYYCKRTTVFPCVVCKVSSAAYFFYNPVSRVRWWAFSVYSVVICFSTSLYFWDVFWYSSTILLSCVLRFSLKSAITLVLVVYVFSNTFSLSEDSYTYVPSCLSNLSRFSRMVETVIRVVELAFRSVRIS
jgi:hypothetical protein